MGGLCGTYGRGVIPTGCWRSLKRRDNLEDRHINGDNTTTDLNSVHFPCISFTTCLKPIRNPYLMLHILLLTLSPTCFGSFRTILREKYKEICIGLFLFSGRTQHFRHYALIIFYNMFRPFV